jgi:hypothetical protein
MENREIVKKKRAGKGRSKKRREERMVAGRSGGRSGRSVRPSIAIDRSTGID